LQHPAHVVELEHELHPEVPVQLWMVSTDFGSAVGFEVLPSLSDDPQARAAIANTPARTETFKKDAVAANMMTLPFFPPLESARR
jgi:hypothetical protein